jgi:hypothetical protein
MSRRDWQYVGWAGSAGLGLVAIHGKTSKQWTEAHTFFALLSLAAMIGPAIFRD